MITELIVMGTGYLLMDQWQNRKQYKVKKIIETIFEDNNIGYRVEEIHSLETGFIITINLLCEGYEPLEKLQDKFQTGLGHMITIEQNKNYKTATITVYTETLQDNRAFEPYAIQPYEVYMGLNYKLEPLVVNLNQFPHVLVSGQTGSGKSEEIRIILTNLIYNHSERDVEIYFSDLSDSADYEVFKNCKQVKGYASNVQTSSELFNQMMHTYSKRLSIFNSKSCKNIIEYNSKNKEKRMPYIYMVLDEFADFFPVKHDCYKEEKTMCYNSIRELVRKARKAGIFLIIGIQRPDTTVLDPSLKSGLCTKIGFSQNNQASSLVVADTTELTNIENRKALLTYGNKREWFKTLYVSNSIIHGYVKSSIKEKSEKAPGKTKLNKCTKDKIAKSSKLSKKDKGKVKLQCT